MKSILAGIEISTPKNSNRGPHLKIDCKLDFTTQSFFINQNKHSINYCEVQLQKKRELILIETSLIWMSFSVFFLKCRDWKLFCWDPLSAWAEYSQINRFPCFKIKDFIASLWSSAYLSNGFKEQMFFWIPWCRFCEDGFKWVDLFSSGEARHQLFSLYS